ncbi:MAG: serine protease [bacterium]|nr:serine protease [bacterium]
MPKQILIFLLLFLIGAGGGLWAQAFLLPSLSANTSFASWQFLKDWNARIQVIAPVEQIFVRENEAIEKTINIVQDTVVAIKSSGARAGSGLVYTLDGLIVTLSSLVPAGFKVTVHSEGKDPLPAQILKRDVANNLALLKIEDTGLKTTGFIENGGVNLGERVILLAKVIEDKKSTVIVNTGVIKRIKENALVTSIVEKENVDGSPVFDIEGRVVGLVDADLQGNIFVIPSSTLRTFLGL